jgi:dTDP-4-dehydrorhamnose reductase
VSARRLLLLGGTGRLGSALQRCAPPQWSVIAPGREQLDLARAEIRDWQHWIKATAPDVVLNAAAMAGLESCEEDPYGASDVNAEAPGRLARACALEVVPFLHISTDYVFGDASDGNSAPYAEDAPHCPLQRYGQTKAEGESAVLDARGRSSVVRVSWLTEPREGNFASYLLGQVRDGAKQVAVLAQQRTRPTITSGLSRWLFAVAERLASGAQVPKILHPSGCEPVTRVAWAEALLDHFGYGWLRVVDDPNQLDCPEHAVQSPTQGALRPRDSSLDVTKTMAWSRAQGLPELGDWAQQLAASEP